MVTDDFRGGRRSVGPSPTRRVILLGASNLSRGLATIVAMVRQAWSEPLDIVAAPGRGRSYGLTTRLLGRELPSLRQCGLWSACDSLGDLPTCALVTDVGNDVMYGVPVDEILAWVEDVFQRLHLLQATVVATALPLGPLERLTPRQYQVARTLLFPRNRTTFPEARARAEAVDRGLRRLAETYGATLIEPRLGWYGIDPIHVRRSQWNDAWGEIVGAWRPPSPIEPVVMRQWTWLRSQLWQPAERRWFGIPQRRAQPAIALADGTHVSLY
jgi:hypothetical protein